MGVSISFIGLTFFLHENISNKSQSAAVVVPLPDSFASVHLEAQSAYVYDISHQRVLYTLNPDTERPLASLTKVAMALAVSEVLQPDTILTIPGGMSQILVPDTTWSVHDILDFTLVASSNQGADVLSDAANDALHRNYPESPAVGATVWRMNAIAKELGLTSMYFINDNGLDVSTTHAGAYGSARDVGTLLAYAASTTPATFAATAHSIMTFRNSSGQTATAINTDTALGAIPGIIMGKTGFTDLAGGNLGVVFDAGIGRPIVVVVLGSTQQGRFDDMRQLVLAATDAIAHGE
jgi:D-alanyl-D-alanine carboxypeptidase